MKEKVNVAVVGATGVVGETIIQILEERDFPVEKLIPLASERSIGKKVEFRGKHIDCELLNDFDFSQADIALFSAGGGISAEYAP
ncbi:MAG: aspartate-semialdehyde dehydrogenase, partial [Gammaproteobacteria bacterium]|nr:aspartate-semialdehyde dehydrogenase [Gammaproteobacteria bacterium]